MVTRWQQQLERFRRFQKRLPLFFLIAIIGTLGPWGWQEIKRLLAGSLHCVVSSIHDGDTLRAECGSERIQVRFYCLDAPELAQRPWGLESRDYLRSLIPSGADIRLRLMDTDRYGRRVAEIYKGDTNINLEMVKAGQAAVYSPYCHESGYFTAEALARKKRIGIWDKPGIQQTPWNYRHTDQ